jgi:tRNA A-37 threonylcarbamoyl transferase component Bud32
VSDLLSLGAPSYEELAARQLRRLDRDDEPGERWGRYRLRAPIPAGPGDECFVAVQDGLVCIEKLSFLRRFPRARLDGALVAAVRRRAEVNHRGVEQLYDLGELGRHGYLVSELVQGLGVDHLDEALRRRGERLPWPVALAMFHDACERVSHLHAAGVIHGDVTPARLRLSLTGILYLCYGLPAAAEPSWGRALCDVARPILQLAATDEERALLDEILGDADGEGALAVASDALVLRHPELDPILPALLLSALEDAPLARGRATALLLEDLPYLPLHRLWQLVADVLAAPRPGRG